LDGIPGETYHCGGKDIQDGNQKNYLSSLRMLSSFLSTKGKEIEATAVTIAAHFLLFLVEF